MENPWAILLLLSCGSRTPEDFLINIGFFDWIESGRSRFANGVRIKIHSAAIAAALIAGFSSLPKAGAELPSLDQQPWIGYYAAFASKRFNFGVTSQGNIALSLMNQKGEPAGEKLAINFDAGIEEILPDGKVVMKQFQLDSLETDQAATNKLEKAVIRGKVTGDAKFELNLEQNRGIIFIGGRVLDPGTLTKNPLRFAVRVRIPNAYPYLENKPEASSEDGGKKDKDIKKAEKAFLKKIKDDSLVLKWTDGTKVKKDYEEAVDATSKDLNGPGIASAEITASSYHENRLVFTAAPNSAMTLRNPKPAPLHEGYVIMWAADTAKDPGGLARLAIEVK